MAQHPYCMALVDSRHQDWTSPLCWGCRSWVCNAALPCWLSACWWLQEIAAHSDTVRRTQESNKSLQLEIKQLSAELRDVTVQHRIFPELYSLPHHRLRTVDVWLICKGVVHSWLGDPGVWTPPPGSDHSDILDFQKSMRKYLNSGCPPSPFLIAVVYCVDCDENYVVYFGSLSMPLLRDLGLAPSMYQGSTNAIFCWNWWWELRSANFLLLCCSLLPINIYS